ncbi:MAG TPA: hypothetical protein DDX75_08660 [Phycisphaerales bacterium]|nr:hypothetical protein [Phycisphaerales bacterium]
MFHYKLFTKRLIGLVLASALAAAISSLSANINSISATFVVNIYIYIDDILQKQKMINIICVSRL